MPRVAIVIVTFNSALPLRACLDSLPRSPEYEIVVVDNASSDSTRDIVSAAPGVTLVANAENLGFAAAVNQGTRATTSPLVLILNPDTRCLRGLEHLVREFENPGTGAAGGMLSNPDGTPQKGFMYRRLPSPAALILETLGVNRLWPGNPINWRYRCLGDEGVESRFVEQPAGAFLMFSREAWDRLRGFNESFFPIWFEDVDFCARLMGAGYSIRYNGAASAVHEGGHSIGTLGVHRELHWYGNLLGYAAIHYGALMYRVVCCAVALGAVLRAGFNLPVGGFKALAVYGAVCRLAMSRLFRPRRDQVVLLSDDGQ